MSKKKQFFAQNNKLDAFNHRAKHFWNIEEAERWLISEGDLITPLRIKIS